MTCICAIVFNDTVYMGADSCASNEYVKHKVVAPKIFFHGDKFLFGYAGSFRFGQLLEYSFVPPPKAENQSDIEYLCTDFVDALRKCLYHGGTGGKKDDIEWTEGSCLIGFNGALYILEGDYQVRELQDYGATGSGEEIALGALYAMKGKIPRKSLKIALEAAAEHNPYVQAPFHFAEL